MLIFLFALFIGCSFAKPNVPRIDGGLPASEGQFKYLAQLIWRNHDRGYFTGSIISDQWILTTASLPLEAKPKDVTAIVGTTKMDDESGWGYDVSDIITYPNFTSGADIALVKVKGRIMLGENVATVMLSSATRIPPNVSVIYAGWGQTGGSSSPHAEPLKYIILNTIGTTECEKLLGIYRKRLNDAINFCTAPLAGNGPCHGEIGAPVVYGNYVIGIAAGRFSCSSEQSPTVFRKIGIYGDWIKEITGILNYIE